MTDGRTDGRTDGQTLAAALRMNLINKIIAASFLMKNAWLKNYVKIFAFSFWHLPNFGVQ